MAAKLKREGTKPLLAERVLTLIFEKPSTRTRVAFEAGMAQLGGQTIFLDTRNTQQARGESLADTARVIASMCDIVAIRAPLHTSIAEFSRHSKIPVINALSNREHPCQVLADIMTFEEMRGSIAGARIAWIGDLCNVSHSWIAAAGLFDFDLQLAIPAQFRQQAEALEPGRGRVAWAPDPITAATGADCVVTDVWTSMGDEDEELMRRDAFAEFTVDAALMERAAPNAGFMHCLPCRRGEEVSAEVIDGKASWVWTEAENRLHSQKALILFLLDQAL